MEEEKNYSFTDVEKKFFTSKVNAILQDAIRFLDDLEVLSDAENCKAANTLTFNRHIGWLVDDVLDLERLRTDYFNRLKRHE